MNKKTTLLPILALGLGLGLGASVSATAQSGAYGYTAPSGDHFAPKPRYLDIPSISNDAWGYNPANSFFSIGPGIYRFDLEDNNRLNLDYATMGGVSISGGSYYLRSDVGALYVQADTGFYYAGEENNTNVDSIYAIPLWSTVGYQFDVSEVVKLRAGLTFGATFIGGEADGYSGPYYIHGNFRQLVATAGLNLGISFNFNENFFLDLSYRALVNSKMETVEDFEKSSSTAQQVSLAAGWRF